jgi:hypothetical protein
MAMNVVGVPDGYVAVPIDTDRGGAALRVCVLFKREAESSRGISSWCGTASIRRCCLAA